MKKDVLAASRNVSAVKKEESCREKPSCLPSLFKGFFAKESMAVEWPQVFNYLIDGGLREATERYRFSKDGRYKSSLPSLMPACGTNGRGKEAADITGLTGVSMADFDGIQVAAIEAVRAVVNADPHTLLSYVTVSGEGLRILFRYEMGEGCEEASDKEKVPGYQESASCKASASCNKENLLSEEFPHYQESTSYKGALSCKEEVSGKEKVPDFQESASCKTSASCNKENLLSEEFPVYQESISYTGALSCKEEVSGKEKIPGYQESASCKASASCNKEKLLSEEFPDYQESTSYTGGISPEEKRFYEKAFLMGNCYYADLIGHGFDEKCVNVNRLSALCHDPKAFFNEEAVPFVLTAEADAAELASPETLSDWQEANAGGQEALVPLQETIAPVQETNADLQEALGERQNAYAGTISLAEGKGSNFFSQSKSSRLSKRAACIEPPLSLTAYAAGIIEKHGDYYTEGNRNQYLMKCLMMMNKLGVPQTEAEGWALSYDLGEAEIRRIVRSCYSHTAEHGVYEVPERRNFPVSLPAESCNVANVADDFFLTHTCAREEDEKIPLPPPPLFPSYEWPRFLGQIVDCGETAAQRDVLLLGALTVFGASLNRRVRFLYGHKFIHPCLQVFVVAPPASGKGALTWVRKLVEPLHNRMMGDYYRAMETYKQEKVIFEQAGRARAEMKAPELPPMKMFLIAGNNSATGVLENLMDADGVGLICESEADTLSAAIGTDYGHWSDTLRKAFDHDRLSYNRRTNREYREISRTFLSVLLSGTPAQVQPLIPSAENGLFSRQLFYSMPATTGWVNQFGGTEGNNDLDRRFEAWGKEWEQRLQELVPRVSVLTFLLTDVQQYRFNDAFTRLFDTACITQNGTMKSSVTRLAVNILRLCPSWPSCVPRKKVTVSFLRRTFPRRT